MYPTTEQRAAPGVKSLHAELFSEQQWLVHAFSTRVGGTTTAYGRNDDLNLGITAHDSPSSVHENRSRFLDSVGPGTLVLAKQVHSALSIQVGSAGLPPSTEADGLMTNEPGVLVGIQTADCVPVLVADPVTRSIAAFHAGWRGTVQRTVEQGIAKMAAEFGSNPADLLAAIGPSIGACCYAVGDEVQGAFCKDFPYAQSLFSAERKLDLKEANRRQLLDAGLGAENIAVVPDCTSCQPDRYFSHRAQQGLTGRMLSVIGLRPRP
jgi:YfiH family protein